MHLSSVIHTGECGHSTDCLFRICNASAVHISIDLQCNYETFTFANWSPQTKGDFLKRRCLHHPVFVLPEKQSRDLAHPLRILFLDVFFPAEVKRASAQKPGPNCSCRRFSSSLQWDRLDDCVHVMWKLLVLRLGTSCWVIQAGIWISWSAEVFSSLMLIRLCGPTLLGWTHLGCHIQN